MAKKSTGKTLFILDEPTTGLHFEDIRRLLDCLKRLRDLGNSMVIIEHNMDVIKCADWIIDLGPDAGEFGGEIIATGTPEEVAKNTASLTGKFLAKVLENVGAAKIIKNDELNGEILNNEVEKIILDQEKCAEMGRNAYKVSNENVEDKIYEEIKKLVK